MNAKRFEGKTVIVTGGSRGIGRAIALEFGKEGANVVVNFFKEKGKAEEVAGQIESSGGHALIYQADVSLEEEVGKMVAAGMEKFGRVDILVNNAGIVVDKRFSEKTVEDWQKMLAVDLIGPFICAKAVIPIMKKQKWGRIINISSTNGVDTTSPESIDYDAAKAGLISMTRNLAEELAPDILVNSVAPGWVDTDMNALLPPEFIAEETARIARKKFATPEEIARPVLFFASEDANNITGQTLKVDGGYQ
ncbi:MAG TPA: 3-oxoacyl-ACP reductase family protein [Candidatus Paceibacterota bacterium]|nr:3-oxoacyl-ACP reductase family protein [Candidatus Paceibacterota bacterium]